jgi:hypothetical protein
MRLLHLQKLDELAVLCKPAENGRRNLPYLKSVEWKAENRKVKASITKRLVAYRLSGLFS